MYVHVCPSVCLYCIPIYLYSISLYLCIYPSIYLSIYLFSFRLRYKWSEALSNRREFLDTEVRKIMDKGCQTDADSIKQNELIDQWTMLQVHCIGLMVHVHV